MKVSKLYLGSMRQGGGLVRVFTVSRARPRLKSLMVIPMKKTGMEMRSPMRMVTSLSTSILRMCAVHCCLCCANSVTKISVHMYSHLYTLNSWSM